MNKEISLLALLNFYKNKFCVRKCIIETGYNPVNPVCIFFSEEQFPHLIGLHKVGKSSGKRAINEIKQEKVTLKDIKKHDNYSLIKPRIKGFYRIEDMLLGNTTRSCILNKDNHNKSKMNQEMDIILLDKKMKNDRVYVLGLKKDIKRQIYYPSTFHQAKYSKYKTQRMTRIKKITWENFQD